ncbi:DUF192 domain-containing protein [Rhodanobacter koreensis]
MKSMLVPMLFLLAGCTNSVSASHASLAVELHGQHFSVELATNDASREHGLMMRTTLPADHGMLFVFPDTAPRGFWMKSTLIPLDILYFDADRRLVSMQLNTAPCKADPCPIYPSSGPARYVLELSAGTAARIGARVADELKIAGDVGTVR